GAEVNSAGSENRPYVTRDGKYFFFTSTRNGSTRHVLGPGRVPGPFQEIAPPGRCRPLTGEKE
ncbi:MAG: hypothetical protein MZV63_13345, partial [Marinilabiliales bacterium]|nr:hypothetical protein [Marinilabiliales bacterium]